MKKINADGIIEYILCTIGLFYMEYDIGKDIIRIYNINKIVKISLVITIAIYILFTLYLIKSFKFSEFKIYPVKNFKEYLIRLIKVILFTGTIAATNIFATDSLQEPKTLIILSIILIILIITLRIYYISTVNKNKFHYFSLLIIIYVTYLIIISSLNLVILSYGN